MAVVDTPDPEPSPARPRYLGLDVGTKRVGVAVSDELGSLARPVLTLWRKKPREDVRSLARLARRHGCSGIVVGNPLHMSGEASPLAAKIQRFAEELSQFSGLPIIMWDERLTTREAHQLLYEAGKPRQEHGALVDQVAAVLILQSFLNSKADAKPDADRPAPEDGDPHAPGPTSPAKQV